jgi:hypothetical protein
MTGVCPPPATDERGLFRPSGTACDSGAYEVGAAAPTTTTLMSSPNPSSLGQSVTFTATIMGNSPTGTVNFQDGGVTVAGCGAQPISGGTATCATSGLSAGSHPITAVYSGDINNAGSTSNTVNQAVNAGSSSVLTSAPNPSILG